MLDYWYVPVHVSLIIAIFLLTIAKLKKVSIFRGDATSALASFHSGPLSVVLELGDAGFSRMNENRRNRN